MSTREVWTDAELASAVEAYVFMLRMERAGLPYRKEAARDVLLDGPLENRNDAAIRYRMRNISAVITELGGPVLPAYTPAEQVGVNVRLRVRSLLEENPGFRDIVSVIPTPEVLISSPDLRREEALAHLSELRSQIALLERLFLGVGHNGPPEPLTMEAPARHHFAQARADIAALEAEVQKDLPDKKDVKSRLDRLLDFGLRASIWLGQRVTKFIDKSLEVAVPIVVAQASGLLPVLIETIQAVTKAVSRN